MDQILLIGGSPRSGTTFIGLTLNFLPTISLFSEFSITDVLRSLDEMFILAESEKPDTLTSSVLPLVFNTLKKPGEGGRRGYR